ncbi:MAM and LDL-receptor class A domain-containing protein 1-like [Actinia tenebrosa]|uniref:MAM and LDL-receptor class A domain-containing protein 1-like n=1 Tax=Actinia tenebrosa TaxID=6105 RepID=A0A6P8I3U8_ACTTE|nr:MAM and LDL-receptor class A domain-containing protein 1-like [Actinia tenebrosa]
MQLFICLVIICALCQQTVAFPKSNDTTTRASVNSITVVQVTTVRVPTTPSTTSLKLSINDPPTTDSTPIEELPHPGDCDFDSSFCNWTNTVDDEFDWTRLSGRTASSNTGPSSDVTGRGYYAYIEASWPRRPGHVARLISPVTEGVQCMRFYYNMFGRYMGDLQIFIKENSSMVFLWGRYKNQGRGWHSTNVTVYGESYRIVFFARVGKSYTGDLAIDNITFVSGTCDGKPLFYQEKVKDVAVQLAEGEPGTCNFDGGFCEWINVPIGDNFDWTLHRGRTGTGDTGPLYDHAGNNGYYLYIEASTPRLSRHSAQLLSPRLCGTMCMHFYYHMYGSDMGELNIYQRRGLRTDDRIWGARGEQGDVWHETLIDISGNCYQIVIEGIIGNGYLGDAAIDDVVVTKGSCCAKRHLNFDVKKEGNCSFDSGFCKWKNLKEDDFNWSLIDKETPSTKTGPDGPFNSIGQYAYVEASEPRLKEDRAVLVGPVISGFVCLRFKYHMYGQHTGALAVYQHGSGVLRHRLWVRQGNMGNLWRDAYLNIGCKEPHYQIEFEAIIGGWRSDIAIDEITFSHTMCNTTIDVPIPSPPITLPPTLYPLCNGDCTFPGSFCEWKNDRDDQFDWLIGQGSTPSLVTGPKRDVDGNEYYIYIEASLYRYKQRASLVSGYMRGTKCMQFHYHMHGRGIGVLTIQMINTNNNDKKTIWYRAGQQGENWIRTYLNVQGTGYKIAIVGEIGGATTGDIAIDDISFTDGQCKYLLETVLDDILPVPKTDRPYEDRPENCTFDDNHMCRWVNDQDDMFDWILWKKGTPSRLTGPSSDHGGKGMYIYTEATAPRQPGDKAQISLIRSSGISCMRFCYHMYGEDTGELNLYHYNTRTRRRRLIWSRSGPQGNEWLESKITFLAGTYQLTFEAVRGSGFKSDIALDDIIFTDGPCVSKPSQRRTTMDTTTSSIDDSLQVSLLMELNGTLYIILWLVHQKRDIGCTCALFKEVLTY